MNDQGRSVTMRALMRALSGSACGCPCCEAPRNRRCAVCACHPLRHWCSHSGLSPTSIIFHFMSRFSLLYNSLTHSSLVAIFHLCFHCILTAFWVWYLQQEGQPSGEGCCGCCGCCGCFRRNVTCVYPLHVCACRGRG